MNPHPLSRRALLGGLATAAALRGAGSGPPERFQADWNSLGAYECPDWFRDAKFGIFMHWGIPAVTDENRPFSTGHYANGMYYQHGNNRDGTPVSRAHIRPIYDYHVRRYGHPSKFGYKDFIPQWKAERWDPLALTRFYQQCGARYIVPVAVHHDNFDVFDSSHRWNAARMGPKKDILLGWKKAAAACGLRFGCSSHLDRALSFLEASRTSDYEGPLKNLPYDGANPRYADFYLLGMTQRKWEEVWYRRTLELVDAYEPDLLYFDGPLPFGDFGLRIAAHLYTTNSTRHGGRCEAVLNVKRGPNHKAYVWDIERGQTDRLQPYPWQTDTTLISGWFYHKAELEMTADVALANLLDIVSKNGNLLLNVGLKPDGTIPENQRGVLEAMGAWLRVYGEAIYGTRPWRIFGEGPTEIKAGSFQEQRTPFQARDVRFTSKGETLYAAFLAPPSTGAATIAALAIDKAGRYENVVLAGSGAAVDWKQDAGGMHVRFANPLPVAGPPVLRIAR